ncbi:MAG: response regulator [Polyangiales bacterium]
MNRQLLIVDDDFTICKALRRYYARTRPVAVAHSVSEALVLINTTPRWSGAIIDYQFPDGDGLTVLDAFRKQAAQAPVLVLTGIHTPHVNHRASELGAQFVMKPAPTSLLRAFANRLSERTAPAEIDREIERAVEEFELTPGESKILNAAVHGLARDGIADHLSLAESTVKTQVRNLVAKCAVPQLGDAVRLVWERASTRSP